MRQWSPTSTRLATGLVFYFVSASGLRGAVVRAPLMGQVLVPSPSASWLSETRIVNPSPLIAHVTITDVVGAGNPVFREFVIPANGILDLRNFELFFNTDPPGAYYPPLLALMEFTSDQPIIVFTQISAREPDVIGTGDCPFHPYFGGDCVRPVAGPLLRGFQDYISAGAPATLAWLTAGVGYRDNLFFTNPSEVPLSVTATFRSASGDTVATKTYEVASRSLVIIPDALRDPSLAGAITDGAVTARFAGDGPFYVFAAVISEALGCGVQPLYALVQPLQ